MRRFVLDCSVTMAWCFESEADGYTLAVLGALADGTAIVPPLWPLEVATCSSSQSGVGGSRGEMSPASWICSPICPWWLPLRWPWMT